MLPLLLECILPFLLFDFEVEAISNKLWYLRLAVFPLGTET